jgi:pimeloyl-ACP methyl ester carboxylesterase
MSNTCHFVNITWQQRDVDIEYKWVGSHDERQPTIVFLHEGLGSVSMWKDFPQQLCESLNIRGLIYSRPGYGQSTVHPPHYRYSPNFMHEQAFEVLPSLLDALGINAPVFLLGHSDGASIALLYASMHNVQGVIVLAPHLFVEDLTVSSIVLAKQAYQTTDLRSKLSRHHLDVDSTFWCWNHVWLSPCFRGWSIESEAQHITAPVLAIQGQDDEYGTLHQIECLPKLIPNAHAVSLSDCKHSPHRDQSLKTLQHCAEFVRRGLPRQIKGFPE